MCYCPFSYHDAKCTKTAFLVIWVAIFLESLQLNPTLIYSDMKYFIGFSNDLKMHDLA